MVLAMTSMMEAMNANPNAGSNFDGLKSVLEQPMMSFKEALFNPILEGVFNDASPLINDAMPIIEDLAGTVGDVLKPVFYGLGEVLKLITPVMDWITTLISESIGGLFDWNPQKWDTPGYTPAHALVEGGMGAIGGAAMGFGIGALASHWLGPGALVVGGVGAVIGGIAGFWGGFIG